VKSSAQTRRQSIINYSLKPRMYFILLMHEKSDICAVRSGFLLDYFISQPMIYVGAMPPDFVDPYFVFVSPFY
jgi:hypothetical protein